MLFRFILWSRCSEVSFRSEQWRQHKHCHVIIKSWVNTKSSIPFLSFLIQKYTDWKGKYGILGSYYIADIANSHSLIVHFRLLKVFLYMYMYVFTLNHPRSLQWGAWISLKQHCKLSWETIRPISSERRPHGWIPICLTLVWMLLCDFRFA